MKEDEDFVVLRATIGARMQAGQSAHGIATVLWEQGYREKATTTRAQLKVAVEALKLESGFRDPRGDIARKALSKIKELGEM